MPAKKLSIADHSRDSAGLTYVYPVLSRRAGGLSLGINLNPNNACNWRCIYCQVPDLKRGSAPPIDLKRLEQELRRLIASILNGDFYESFEVEAEFRQFRDIAISGNGEPTSAREFHAVIVLLGQILEDFGLAQGIKLVLITNGSLMHRDDVQKGLTAFNRLGGEIWFKLDRASDRGLREINNAGVSARKMLENLGITARLCPTWIQSCIFKLDGAPPPLEERNAYLDLLSTAIDQGILLQGVLLYGLARPSLQPEAPRLGRADLEILQDYARLLEQLGLTVRISN